MFSRSFSATLIGSTAILMWGTLPLLTTYAGKIPPFLLVSMTFSLAFILTAVKWLFYQESPLIYLRHPLPVWLIGVGGLFGYHFLYFTALQHAPVIEASLINYLWPLFIVLLTAGMAGKRLQLWQIGGACCGFFGCFLLITRNGSLQFAPEFLLGYFAAFGCAVIWAGYSVLSRRFPQVPTDTVGWFCLVTAGLGLICHFLFETTLFPQTLIQWLAIFALGIAPVGIAFFAWDYGVKQGNLTLLGVFSYGTPLIATTLLILFGKAEASINVIIAAILIVSGAVLAARKSTY